MLKKKKSLVTYTIIMCGLIMTVGIACLLFIQNSIVKDDMELQAYEKLSQEHGRSDVFYIMINRKHHLL